MSAMIGAPRAPGGLDADARELLRELVARHTGVRLDPDQGSMIEARLTTFLRSRPSPGVDAVLACVGRLPDGPLAVELAEALTNGETSFFRDPLLYDELRDWVIPALLRSGKQRLELWSAACSTGQEPYSLAMLIATAFPELLEPGRLRIVASDVSRDKLARAEAASYSRAELNRGLPAPLFVECFEADEPAGAGLGQERWRLRREIRSLVELRHLDLRGPWPLLPPMDLVLVRNVMLYWAEDARRELLTRVADQLAPGAFLALGGSELIPRGLDRFDLARPGRWRFFQPRGRAQAQAQAQPQPPGDP